MLKRLLLAFCLLLGCTSGPIVEHDSTGLTIYTWEWPCERRYPELRGDLCWTSLVFRGRVFVRIEQGGPWS